MHTETKLIETFYTCFQQRNGQAMADCYHPNVQFSDPVFPHLTASKAGSMWKMLCSQAQGFELNVSQIQANDTTGTAHWEAKYDFSATGRRVHNKVDATFHFQDGKIIKHQDNFNFWTWSIMALGIPGLALGWTPIIRHKVQQQAAMKLEKFIHSETKNDEQP